MIKFIFDVTVGRHAAITSGALGILGSLALAIPPIESGNLRTVLLQLEEIAGGISEQAFKATNVQLIAEAKRLLAKERLFNFVGAVLLLAAFVILFANSIYCSNAPHGTCQG